MTFDRQDQSELAAQLTERLRVFARREAMWEPESHLLLAVSGGADSVAMLEIFDSALKTAEHLQLTIAHIHHGLRLEADEDAAYVRALAAARGIPYEQRHIPVLARMKETGESLEEAGRNLRYNALADIACQVHADRIVTAHTADDQAETLLMRILRGTGTTGLAGIPPRRGQIIRPMLPLWRSEIEAYLHWRGIEYRTDVSNSSREFMRNRLRLDLLPDLEMQYAPRLRERLWQLGELARADSHALARWTEASAVTLLKDLPEGVAVRSDPQLPDAVRWRLLRLAIGKVSGNIDDIHFAHIQALDRMKPGDEVHLPGLRVLHESGQLVFLPLTSSSHTVPLADQALATSGWTSLPQGHCRLHVIEQSTPLLIAGGDIAVCDADAVHGNLRVRSWQPGDRFRPYGAAGSRKLQDIFVDAGVPRRLRTHVPVIYDDDGIVWLAGFRIADRVKVVPATKRYFRIQVEWESNPWT